MLYIYGGFEWYIIVTFHVAILWTFTFGIYRCASHDYWITNIHWYRYAVVFNDGLHSYNVNLFESSALRFTQKQTARWGSFFFEDCLYRRIFGDFISAKIRRFHTCEHSAILCWFEVNDFHVTSTFCSSRILNYSYTHFEKGRLG